MATKREIVKPRVRRVEFKFDERSLIKRDPKTVRRVGKYYIPRDVGNDGEG